MKKPYNLRSLDKKDYGELAQFLQGNIHLHRHLDWHPPIEWLGKTPFEALEQDGKIQAVLAMPDDPPGAFWVRLFASLKETDYRSVWNTLFSNSRKQISSSYKTIFAALAYEDWFIQLLTTEGWLEHQRVILLKWHPQRIELMNLPEPFMLRPMTNADLEAIAHLDQNAFDLLWQQSLSAIHHAFLQTSYSTVVELENRIIGYQMSTSSSFSAHLARLAVLPEMQGRGIGSTLVKDMLNHFRKPWVHEVSVNTQQDNFGSLKLYEKIGFIKTGDGFPVFVHD